MAASQAERPYITCHVLDTVAGKPAAGIDVELTLLTPLTSSQSAPKWTAKTNADGRVGSWHAEGDAGDLNAAVAAAQDAEDATKWLLSFHTEPYFGKGKTFWPEVDLKFVTLKHEQHYHVPLLLGPWSYTTYRGS